MAGKTTEPSSYQSFFGLPKDGSKKPVPKWVPVALIAVSTAAMVVPIVMLRRHRAAATSKSLANAPPPPRRTTSARGVPIANPTVKPPVFSIRDPVPSSSSSSSLATSSSAGKAKAEDNFNGALHCAKAFGAATLLVGTGAAVSVYGLKTYMGVKTTQEFADRMRTAILERMPLLSSRIHRAPEADDGDALLPVPQETATEVGATAAYEEWTWPAAEHRLREAYDKHGFYGWTAAAMRELEAEGQAERAKRGHV